MSKKAFKSQASSSRAASGAFGGFGQGDGAFGGVSTAFGGVPSSPLSYVYEPPDLSGLSDPNVVVAFKNLLKKDGTTKSKALEDLQNYIASLEKDGVEEAVLEAWIKVYPRTSIDSSRRVRQLAHSLQGQIAISCGKRLAKHMPSIVPSWLVGLYDPDKSVNRAAQDSFSQMFATQEKVYNLWRAYHTAIVEYARDVILKETENTLSDDRTTNPDDALAKYARVVGCAVTVLTRLLEIVSQADLEKSGPLFDALFDDVWLWKLASHQDAFVRRAIFRLLVVCLEKRTRPLDPLMLSTNVLTGGLHTSQMGSSLDCIRAVVRLSKDYPTVWTTDYTATGKKSALNRLRHYLRKGSQGGPAEYWTYVTELLSNIPVELLLTRSAESSSEQSGPDDDQQPLSVLEALREGATNKDEPRSNSGQAWNTYLDVCNLVISHGKTIAVPQFLSSSVNPIIQQHIKPSSDLSRWVVVGAQQQKVCAKACELVLRGSVELFEKEWHKLSNNLIQDFRVSLPEQSKEYCKSQELIAVEASRWYHLQATLIEGAHSELVTPTIQKEAPLEALAAISIVKARNGKPYGAASALQTAMQSIPNALLSESTSKDALIGFVNNDIPNLLTSPSANYLIRLLDLMSETVDVLQAYPNCLWHLEDSPESPAKQATLKIMLSSPAFAEAGLLSITRNKSLRHAVDSVTRNEDEISWSLVMAAVGNAAAPKELGDDILARMTDGLSIEKSSRASLHGLELMVKQEKISVRDFAAQSKGSTLMSKLLFLADAPDLVTSQKAKKLTTDIEGALAAAGAASHTTRPLVKVVQRGFETAGPESLSIESLVSQAAKILKQTPQAEVPPTIAELLPDSTQWTAALVVFLNLPPNPSLAVTNAFGAATTLIQADPEKELSAAAKSVPKDGEGRSALLRILQYVTRLIQVTDLLPKTTEDQGLRLLQNVALTIQLAGDNISLSGSMPLWATSDSEIEAEVAESIFEAQKAFANWIKMAPLSTLVPRLLANLLKDSKGVSPSSYYHARAYFAINDELAEMGQLSNIIDANRIRNIRKSPDIFADLSMLLSSDSKDVLRPFNEFLSELTTLSVGRKEMAHQVEGLRFLLILNCLLYRPDELVTDIPQQRLVFYVQHIISEIGTATFSAATEIIRSLNVILPAIREIYGSFWGDVFRFVQSTWTLPVDDEHLPGLHASLRLLLTLKRPLVLVANDDLADAWAEHKGSITKGLVTLLERAQHLPDESHLPRRILNELISRQLAGSSQDLADEEESLFSVLGSESITLQRTAYELLHEQIPEKQEQLSLDKALTKDYEAKLPEELLSLILAPPTVVELSEASFERTMPPSLRSYLLSWILVFDHWKKASNALQIDYAKSLAESTYLKDLLNLTFKLLITARPKPVDAFKFDIETYTTDLEPPEKDTHWLLIHLYYLCLKYLPTQSKAWWRDTTSRQTNIAVETWTQKYISKYVIASELDAIREWAPSQTTDDQPLTIKVSSSAREITASTPVDEQTMVFAIRLPPSYPLARAEAEGVHRVGVPEKKWASWVRNAQGQLTIAGEGGGNALIDCLLAWRRNVTAAMKGQSECAICYSVVGADKSLPSKVCRTCKNKFHGVCLYRWFSSSNSSSCPLCRNTFTYS